MKIYTLLIALIMLVSCNQMKMKSLTDKYGELRKTRESALTLNEKKDLLVEYERLKLDLKSFENELERTEKGSTLYEKSKKFYVSVKILEAYIKEEIQKDENLNNQYKEVSVDTVSRFNSNSNNSPQPQQQYSRPQPQSSSATDSATVQLDNTLNNVGRIVDAIINASKSSDWVNSLRAYNCTKCNKTVQLNGLYKESTNEFKPTETFPESSIFGCTHHWVKLN
jgi:hypothetical protein